MRAAIIRSGEETPKYVTDFKEPLIQNENELLITMKAAAIKNFDKLLVKGNHYDAGNIRESAKVVGVDGVGLLADGTRVYAMGKTGMLAEKAVIEKNKMVNLPAEIDNASAAALPNAVLGSLVPLLFRAKFQRGETVLINGATGVTGRIAVQLSKYYGAGKVIVTGRNLNSLQEAISLGADEIIPFNQDKEITVTQIQAFHKKFQVDVVIDYLWGHSAEMIIAALKNDNNQFHPIRFVTAGSTISDTITISSSFLRNNNIQISGSGLPTTSPDEKKSFFNELLPECFQLAAKVKLKIDTVNVSLQDIEQAWNMNIGSSKRLVVSI